MKGRKPFGTLYQKKGDSNWRVELSGRGVVSLNTTNRNIAAQRLADLLRPKKAASFNSPQADAPKSSAPTPIAAQSDLDRAGPTDAVSAAPPSTPIIEHDIAASVLGEWVATRPKEEEPETDDTEADDSAEASDAAAADSDQPEYIPPSGGRRKKAGLTPEQVSKIASGLKKAAVKVNIVLDEMVVGWMGRNPCALDDDEVQLLEVGWEMMLEEWFGKNKPEPWMVIAAGNAAVLLAMYVRGEPKERKIVP
jgi:hypothetical protein